MVALQVRLKSRAGQPAGADDPLTKIAYSAGQGVVVGGTGSRVTLTKSADAISTTPTSETVTRRNTSGVSHDQLRDASQARMPVAAAVEVIAPIMHCTHTLPIVATGWSRGSLL